MEKNMEHGSGVDPIPAPEHPGDATEKLDDMIGSLMNAVEKGLDTEDGKHDEEDK